jgi:hypothetical protein
MPITNTMSKFGVPVADGGVKLGILQPKPKFRFRVRVINFGPNNSQFELTRQVESVQKPTINQESVSVHSYNSIAYYAGKHEWQMISLTVKDDISNRVSRLVGHQLQKQMNHFEQTAYPAGINYKFQMFIETLDGGNSKLLEQWFLEGCFLNTVNYGDLNYGESSFQTIEMQVRYDNAQYWGEDGFEVLMPFGPLNANGQLTGIQNAPIGARTSPQAG